MIYPHGDFVQPNLPPPDFDKDILFNTLEKIYSLEDICLLNSYFPDLINYFH